jgi:hypothetical protein
MPNATTDKLPLSTHCGHSAPRAVLAPEPPPPFDFGFTRLPGQGHIGGWMNKRLVLVLVVVVALAYAAIQGFRDGREHKTAPEVAGEAR